MFYLSKRLYTVIKMFGVLGGQGAPPAAPPAGVGLGFSMEACAASGEVDRTEGMVPRAIGRAGAEFTYDVGSGMGAVSAGELRLMEAAKFAVIDTLSKSPENPQAKSLDLARSIASLELSKRTSRERADYLAYFVAHDTVGYGPLGILLEDRHSLEEIEVNAPCAPINIYHVKYGRCRTNLRFTSEGAFRRSINKLIYDTDKELGEDSPIIDAQVMDARIHAQLRPYALSGAVASIRLGSSKIVGLDYLIDKGTTNFEALAYLWLAIDSGRNIVIAGAPASGKTTMLSALFAFIPRFEKVVTIEEEINELRARIDIGNSVELYGSRYGGVSTRDQVVNALRIRPSRIVVGEVRGDETKELFSSANLGIPFITTMHSNCGGVDILKRLLVRPMAVEGRSLSMLDLAIYMKHSDISKRTLSEIYEYKWLSRAEIEGPGIEIGDGDSVEASCVVANGILDKSALQGSKVIGAFSKKAGLSGKQAIREFERRVAFLKAACVGSKNSDEIVDKVNCYGL